MNKLQKITLLGLAIVSVVSIPLFSQSAVKEKKQSLELMPIKYGKHFDKPNIPADNAVSVERAMLGEALFMDQSLSRDYSISCSTCHNAFLFHSDVTDLSFGIDNQKGRRNTQPIFNMAWKDSFFWDGRSQTLRNQSLHPVQDPTEMDLDLDEMVKRLSESTGYTQMFKKAFGDEKVTTERVALALENFMFSLVSTDSPYDFYKEGKAELSALEEEGRQLFFTKPSADKRGAGCFECHSGANFSDNKFHNNGLRQFKDLGRFEFTKNDLDKYKFATPSLRNLNSTAPYMHDGRFNTLEEVIEHYNNPIKTSPTLAPEIAKYAKTGLGLSQHEKLALLAFLETLNASKEHPLPGSQGDKK